MNSFTFGENRRKETTGNSRSRMSKWFWQWNHHPYRCYQSLVVPKVHRSLGDWLIPHTLKRACFITFLSIPFPTFILFTPQLWKGESTHINQLYFPFFHLLKNYIFLSRLYRIHYVVNGCVRWCAKTVSFFVAPFFLSLYIRKNLMPLEMLLNVVHEIVLLQVIACESQKTYALNLFFFYFR